MRTLILFTALIFLVRCPAQSIRAPTSEAYSAMGAYSKNFTDVFSFTDNQAALSRTKNPVAGVYAENRFMLKELKSVAAALALPFEKGGAGFFVNHSGFKNYNESQLGIAYGRALSEKASLGAQINYYLKRIAGYGSYTAICFEVGAVFQLSEKVYTGIHVYNPVGGKFGKITGEKLPAAYTLGLGYEASEKLFISAQAGKEEKQPVNINVAIHYAFAAAFFARCGMASGSGRPFFAVGLCRHGFRFDFYVSWHLQLGLTPSLLIVFPLK